MIKAVRKREKVIADALQNYYAIMSRMLEIREGLIVKYWAALDGRKRDAEIRTTWRTFGSAWRTKGQEMKNIRREAWETFRDERTACGVYGGMNDPEAGGLTADSQF